MTIPVIFILHLFYNLAYAPALVAYTLEILPFAIRAKGFAVVVCRCLLSPWFLYSLSPKNLTVSLALGWNQFVDPWAFDQIGWKYASLYVFFPAPLAYAFAHRIAVPRVLWMAWF